MDNVESLSGKELDEAVGYALGYIDYPSDSVECGRVWHLDAERTPFVRIMNKCDFSPTTNSSQFLDIIKNFDINLHNHTDGEGKFEYASADCLLSGTLHYSKKDVKFAGCRAIVSLHRILKEGFDGN